MGEESSYIAIDLKSFYASAECVDRGLNPLTTNLVVADVSRTDKTICLAVSPSLKSYGVGGRPRLFEVVQKVREVNAVRIMRTPDKIFTGESYDAEVLKQLPEYAVGYITAVPRMARYMELSTQIYHIYLKYIAPEDIHVYSVDEVFIDATHYLRTYGMDARELAVRMIRDVFETTGITATCGIGTNLYLCKVAMDIVAKHMDADENGVRIAQLDEMLYRKTLWNHRPLTDFWRVGKGYARKLEQAGLYTMGDIARCSVGKAGSYYNEDMLYRMFGVNAELLIDHAWGWEPCRIADIKAYRPQSHSLSSGQVLKCPYTFEQAKIVVREMTDALALELVDKGLVTDQIVLTIGYDIANLSGADGENVYKGTVKKDRYGRKVPAHAHGTENIGRRTSSAVKMLEAVTRLYDRIVDRTLLIRRITVTANRVEDEKIAKDEHQFRQLDLFTDYEQLQKEQDQEEQQLEREKRMQKAMLDIKKKYGKNAILKGMNYQEGATARERNEQIGGHKA